MTLIAISAGHNPNQKGASYQEHTEYDEACEWVTKICDYLVELGYGVYEVPTGSLKSKVEKINEIEDIECAIEVHFNAGSFAASGSETLYFPGSEKGKALATYVQAYMSTAIGNRDRGVKEGWYRQDRPGVKDYAGDVDGDETLLYFLRATNCTAIIIEPEFIHHWEMFDSYRDTACRAIALGVKSYLEG